MKTAIKIIHLFQKADGPISLKHWYAILSVKNLNGYNMKVNFKLRAEHINPQFLQKMNVALAFQVSISAIIIRFYSNKW